MKTILLLLTIFFTTAIAAQDPVLAANKCYDEKNYSCATDNYKKAIADKKYAEKDYALIMFRIGYGLKQLGKYDEGIKYLKDAIAAKPAYGDAYWTLGGTYYAAGEYLSASENYGKAIEYYKTEPASLKLLYYWRGQSYNAMEKYEDALTYFDLAIKTDSTVDYFYANAGDVAYTLKKYDLAVNYYAKALATGSKEPEVLDTRYYWLGQAYYQQGKYDEALTAYKKSLDNNSTYGDPQWGIAGIYYNQKKWPQSIAEYTKTIALFKDDTASLKDLYFFRGRSYTGNKEYAKALADFDAILKIDATDRRPLWQTASVSYEQKKYKEAIPKYTQAIEAYKGETSSLDDLYYFRGFCYLQTKDSAKAIADFKESLRLNSKLREPNVYMGEISLKRQQYTEARNYYSAGLPGHIADSAQLSGMWFRKGFANFMSGTAYNYIAKNDLQKSVDYDSSNKEAHRYLADLYYAEKSFALAEKELDKCIVLYKNVKDSLPVMYLYRATARSSQQKYKEALADYEQSDKLKKMTEPGYLVSMGQLAFEIKDYDKTVTFFSRVLPMYKPEQKNELIFAYFGRGRAYLELKKKQPALTDLNKSLELSPGNKDILPWITKAQAL